MFAAAAAAAADALARRRTQPFPSALVVDFKRRQLQKGREFIERALRIGQNNTMEQL